MSKPRKSKVSTEDFANFEQLFRDPDSLKNLPFIQNDPILNGLLQNLESKSPAYADMMEQIIKSAKRNCMVCDGPAAKKCSQCGEMYYCSVDHQKQHWKDHKSWCRKLRQMHAETGGMLSLDSIRSGIPLLQRETKDPQKIHIAHFYDTSSFLHLICK